MYYILNYAIIRTNFIVHYISWNTESCLVDQDPPFKTRKGFTAFQRNTLRSATKPTG
jgi:hypothetical protein